MGIIGSQIKPFTATAFKAGQDFYEVTDEDVKGKWAIFFFYPADFTFVCPTELEDIGEKYEMLQKMDVEVYGVSTDTHFSHKAWHDTSDKIGKLTFPFLGDQNHTLARNFGRPARRCGTCRPGDLRGRPRRCDPDHGTDLRRRRPQCQRTRPQDQGRAICPRQSGQVCPAVWEEGSDTLAPSLDLVGKI